MKIIRKILYKYIIVNDVGIIYKNYKKKGTLEVGSIAFPSEMDEMSVVGSLDSRTVKHATPSSLGLRILRSHTHTLVTLDEVGRQAAKVSEVSTGRCRVSEVAARLVPAARSRRRGFHVRRRRRQAADRRAVRLVALRDPRRPPRTFDVGRGHGEVADDCL